MPPNKRYRFTPLARHKISMILAWKIVIETRRENHVACENTFYQVQSHKWIWHLSNINLCVVCGYQQWNSPLSKVKLQWSIQPRHTQLALDHVTHLNYRNMYIWPPTQLDNITWSLSFDSTFNHNIWSFWSFWGNHLSLWEWYLTFHLKEQAFGLFE